MLQALPLDKGEGLNKTLDHPLRALHLGSSFLLNENKIPVGGPIIA
jgi:hypothetical protein